MTHVVAFFWFDLFCILFGSKLGPFCLPGYDGGMFVEVTDFPKCMSFKAYTVS